MDYKKKYLKYKTKYLNFVGGNTNVDKEEDKNRILGPTDNDVSGNNEIDISNSSNSNAKGPEDPRIFKFGDKKFLLYNNLNNKNERHMYIREIGNEDRPDSRDTEICLEISKKFEKNWGPFVALDKLFFVYSISPLKISSYKNNLLENNLSKCEFIFDENVKIFKFLEDLYSNLHLHIRNSSPLSKFITDEKKMYYLGIGHSVLDFGDDKESILKYFMRKQDNHPFDPTDLKYFTKDFGKIYYTFFYVLEFCLPSYKFKIRSISPMFQFENEYDHTIEFACDLSIVDNDIVYIGYGIDDNRAMLQKMYLRDILGLMINVDDITSKNYDIDAYFLPKLNTFLCNKISLYKYDFTKTIKKYFSDKVIFNLGVEHDYGDEFLICARCYDGNIRSWDGTNSMALMRVKLSSENFILDKEPVILSCWEIDKNLKINDKMISG